MKEENYFNKTLYKYRSLNNFKRFMDILINERLYACKYSEMNDYMEGHYLYSSNQVTRKTIQELKESKKRLGICSLSEQRKNDVMIAHYSDGGRGVVLGVGIKNKNLEVRKVRYVGLPELEAVNGKTLEEKAKEILTHKTESWKYEEEIRAFTSKKYVPVEIKEIIFGPRTAESDKKLIRAIVERIGLNDMCKEWKEVPE